MRVARTVRDHDLVQLIRNQQVAGSNPAGGSTNLRRYGLAQAASLDDVHWRMLLLLQNEADLAVRA